MRSIRPNRGLRAGELDQFARATRKCAIEAMNEFTNELLPIRWSGFWLYPADPLDHWKDPCTWYRFKHPAEIPERLREHYGARTSA
jgi:hypothetical protein